MARVLFNVSEVWGESLRFLGSGFRALVLSGLCVDGESDEGCDATLQRDAIPNEPPGGGAGEVGCSLPELILQHGVCDVHGCSCQ